MQAEMLAKSTSIDTLTAVPGLPDVLANRKPIASNGGETLANSNLADLAGFLPHDELMHAQASIAMQLMLQHPKLNYMADVFRELPPNHMYA
jgi:hypothetical protein